MTQPNVQAPPGERKAPSTIDWLNANVRHGVVKLVGDEKRADQLVMMAVAAINQEPGLAKANPATVLDSIIKAAQLNLAIGGPAGESYLVPFGGECTLIVGYAGAIKLAARAGYAITCGVIYVGDEFDIDEGTGSVSVRPGPRESDEIRGCWARAVGNDVKVALYMSKAQLDRHATKFGKGNVWRQHPIQMRKKTVVIRLCKSLLRSEALNDLYEQEDSSAEVIREAEVHDATQRMGSTIGAALDSKNARQVEHASQDSEIQNGGLSEAEKRAAEELDEREAAEGTLAERGW